MCIGIPINSKKNHNGKMLLYVFVVNFATCQLQNIQDQKVVRLNNNTSRRTVVINLGADANLAGVNDPTCNRTKKAETGEICSLVVENLRNNIRY